MSLSRTPIQVPNLLAPEGEVQKIFYGVYVITWADTKSRQLVELRGHMSFAVSIHLH